MKTHCPVCSSLLKDYHVRHDYYFYECPRCGSYKLTYTADSTIEYLSKKAPENATILSHAIYKATQRHQWAEFDSELLNRIVETGSLPSPNEQLENLIQWVAENQPSLGTYATQKENIIAAVGAEDDQSLGFICGHAQGRRLLTGSFSMIEGKLRFESLLLTFDGWKFLDEIKQGKANSDMAFMAMKFGDTQLDSIYRDHFKLAVAQTGFRLKRLDEGQQAGLIDDHLRNEIRQSKFLIADLTTHNKGAYWEAGYAEGLGKPVIYTCRRDDFDAGSVHFDTNHHLTVIWEPENLGAACAKLKDTIRATFPNESKLSD